MFSKIYRLKETTPDFKQLVYQSFPVPIFCATKQLHDLNRGSSLHAVTVTHVSVHFCATSQISWLQLLLLKFIVRRWAMQPVIPSPSASTLTAPPLSNARALIRTEWWMMVVNRCGRALGINPHVYTPSLSSRCLMAPVAVHVRPTMTPRRQRRTRTSWFRGD